MSRVSKGRYTVHEDNVAGLRNELNFILQAVGDRLDIIENTEYTEYTADSITTKNLTVTDTATIENTCTANFKLTDSVWEDLTADLSAGKAVGANAPTWTTFRSGIEAYAFDDNTMNEMWITFHIKHDYGRETNIYPHMHWAPNTTSTGTVRWGMEYMFAKGHDQEAFPTSSTIYLEQTITSNKQYQHFITEATDEQAFGADDLETDGLLLVRIFRDASNDTFPDPVFGLTSDIHFEVSQIGTPNKAAPFF